MKKECVNDRESEMIERAERLRNEREAEKVRNTRPKKNTKTGVKERKGEHARLSQRTYLMSSEPSEKGMVTLTEPSATARGSKMLPPASVKTRPADTGDSWAADASV
jgi:hypothetical protein